MADRAMIGSRRVPNGVTGSNGVTSSDAVAGGRASYQRGLRVRREVLGDAHVDRSLAAVSEFTRPVQELVTATCWGEVWTRPGLDRRTRSLLNLVMLTALNRNHELAVHVRGAVTNGCTVTEMREALLQTAVYCGAPAALESFRVAERVLNELAAESGARDSTDDGAENGTEKGTENGTGYGAGSGRDG